MTDETTKLAVTPDATPLILAGDGYSLTISTEAEEQKTKLLARSAAVVAVTSNALSADAQFEVRQLAAMRIAVEKSRKEIKEPVNRIGKLIDATAADFIAAIVTEENRIKKLVGDHATEVARLKRIKEEEERKAFEAARHAREEAERAQAAADAAANQKQGIAALLAAKQAATAAESVRAETLATRMDASADVAGTKVAEGVRFAIDFEVENIAEFYAAYPELVKMEVKRAEVLAWLKTQAAESVQLDQAIQNSAGYPVAGIRIFKRPVVSSR